MTCVLTVAMKSMVNNTYQPLFGMSIMLGKNIKLDGPLAVSFCFGSKYTWIHDGGDVLHGVRVSIFSNPRKFRESGSFTMDLYGKCSASETSPDTLELMPIRKFFKKYKVLFAGAWEEQIDGDDITAYLRNRISLRELVQDMPLYDEFKPYLDYVETIADLESVVRTCNLFSVD